MMLVMPRGKNVFLRQNDELGSLRYSIIVIFVNILEKEMPARYSNISFKQGSVRINLQLYYGCGGGMLRTR